MKSLWKLRYIIWICIILFLAAGVYRGHTLGAMYVKEADAVKRPDTHFVLWNSSEKNGNTNLKAKVLLLAGSTDLGEVEIDSAVTIDSNVKMGKGKVLFLNEQDKLVDTEKLDSDGEITVRIPKGKYHILLVGKWMIGSIFVRG